MLFFIPRSPVLSEKFRALFVLMFLLSAPFTSLQSQIPQTRFEKISLDEGLSQNTIHHIHQDRQGFLWFSTRDGLNRYDGYEFKVYRYDPDDSTAIAGNWVGKIFEDSQSDLWIEMGVGGVSHFDRDTGRFTYYRAGPENKSNRIGGILISVMWEDNRQRLWMGTRDGGLNLLDRSTMQFRRLIEPSLDAQFGDFSGKKRFITDLRQDGNGRIWIASTNGLYYIQENSTGEITIVPFEKQEQLGWKILTGLLPDSNNVLWVASNGGGLKKLSIGDDGEVSIRNFRHSEKRSYNNFIHWMPMLKDHSGALWFATGDGGVNRFDTRLETFDYFRHIPGDDASLSSNKVTCFLQTSRSGQPSVWIGTANNGLNLFDASTKTFTRYSYDHQEKNGISHNSITALAEDHSGIFWIGTAGGGINKLDIYKQRWGHFRFDDLSNHQLLGNKIQTFLEQESNDRSRGTLWVGTSHGLIKSEYNKKGTIGKQFSKDHCQRFIADKNNPHSLSHSSVSAIYPADKDHLWIGTFNGLNRFNIHSGRAERFFHDKNNPNSISDNTIVALYRDQRHFLWIGTQSGGLNRYDPATGQFKSYTSESHGFLSNTIWTMMEDSHGNFWVGSTGGGLMVFDRETETVISYRKDRSNPVALNNLTIMCLLEDQAGNLWIGTYSGGLNKLVLKEGRPPTPEAAVFTHYTTREGLPNNMINGIIEDDHQRLWISTNGGISVFDPAEESFSNYSSKEGLQSNEFSRGAYLQSRSGKLFFGGIDGFNMFHPDSLAPRENNAPIVITEFRELGKSAASTDGLVLPTSIELNYDDKAFSFNFALLDFGNPEKNAFAYRLKGVSEDWIPLASQHNITFTNLNPGQYSFEVKGSNNSGFWNEQVADLKIVIHPAFWQTGWFRMLLFLLVAGMLLLTYQMRIRRIRRQKADLEAQVADRTRRLRSKTAMMERLNAIVKTINDEHHFDDLLQAVLEETRIVNNAEKASALVWNRAENCYEFRAALGWTLEELTDSVMTADQVEKRYLAEASTVFENIYVNRSGITKENSQSFSHLPMPKSMLIIRITVNGRPEGYFIFDNMSSEYAFDDVNLLLLRNLKDHLTSAFIKSKILDELRVLNKRKNEFVSIAAHDLRNPLTGVIGYLSIIIERLEAGKFDPVKGIEDLNRVLMNARRMSVLITELLNIAAIESGKTKLNLEKTCVVGLVEKMSLFYQKTAEQKNIDLFFQQNKKAPELLIDQSRIAEVLDNLISNAIKYTFPGGKIEVSYQLNDREIVVAVKDSGQGIAREELQYVFDSFQNVSSQPTGGESSSGLGLPIAKKIIELHGGRIWVTSEAGEGATFFFSLPIEDNAEQPVGDSGTLIIHGNQN